MKKFKKSLSFCMAVCLTLPLYGCFDDREINETAYITALGIDQSESYDYTYTFRFSSPIVSSDVENSYAPKAEGSDISDSDAQSIVITAPDFYIAKNTLASILSKNINMSHLKLIVFSEELNASALNEHSQFLLNEREIRPHTAVAAAKDSAEDFLKLEAPQSEANAAKYYELIAIHSDNIYAPTKTLSDFVDEMSTDSGVSLLPLFHGTEACNQSTLHSLDSTFWISSDTAEGSVSYSYLNGMSIFRNGTLCGHLSGDDTMLYNLLNGDIKSCTITLQNPYNEDTHTAFEITNIRKASYSICNLKEPYRITVRLPLSIEFSGRSLPKGFSSQNELYTFASHALTQRLTTLFADIYRVKKADILNIQNSLKKHFFTQKQWNAFNAADVLESAEFNINISLI